MSFRPGQRPPATPPAGAPVLALDRLGELPDLLDGTPPGEQIHLTRDGVPVAVVVVLDPTGRGRGGDWAMVELCDWPEFQRPIPPAAGS